jgi:hypothetical protein
LRGGKTSQNHQLGGNVLTTLNIVQPEVALDKSNYSHINWLDGRQGISEIAWAAGLLEQLQGYVASTYYSRGGKGNDRGGVLYGKRTGGTIEVLDWRPAVRGQDATSHFYLNEKEEQAFRKLLKLNDSSLEGMEPLGWFRSRTRGDLDFESHDVTFHEKHFTENWHFAVVFRPSHQRNTEAAIYVRNAAGEFEHQQPTAQLSLKPLVTEGAAMIPGVALDEPKPARKSFSLGLAIGTAMLAGVLAIGTVLALQWNRQHLLQAAQAPSPSLGFELVFDDDDLKARWNPEAPAIAGAERAQLLLGGEKLVLSHAELAQGFLKVPLKIEMAADTEISLKVGDREEVAQLVTAAH